MDDRPPYEPPQELVPPSPYAQPAAAPQQPAPGQPATYPPYGAPWPGSPYQPKERASRTLAGWSLGLSLLPCGITQVVALVLGGIVFARSKDGRDHGKGFAIAAYCVVGCWILFAALVAGINALPSLEPERDSEGEFTEAQDVGITELRVGDCFNLPSELDLIYEIEAVPCGEPHDAEVYDSIVLTGDDYPGIRNVEMQAFRECGKGFASFVGTPYRKSKLDVFSLYPREKMWTLGEKVVTCAVFEPSGPDLTENRKVTGTLRGANR